MNHTVTHFYNKDVADKLNFMLLPGINIDYEISRE